MQPDPGSSTQTAPRLARPAQPGRRRTAAQRLLHRGHFAFARALLQGVAVEAVWDRYLSVEGEHTDLRLVPTTIAWIRAEFAAAAKREARPGTARLLQLDVQRLIAASPTLPSLAQFAEEAGLEDESEREQIEAFEKVHGRASARLRRRAQLLKRQLAALQWLEAVAAREPAAGDAVASWLRPELAAFLAAADTITVGQLAERINGIGQNWARGVPGIGPIKARRIAAWVDEHAASIGIAVGAHAQRPRRLVATDVLDGVVARATDIRPLEKFIVPAELDGRQGAYRRPPAHCLMSASTDYEAILAWLRAKRGPSVSLSRGDDAAIASDPMAWLATLSHTQRSYRKEAERFLLWAIVDRRKPLSSMTSEDCVAYRDFLADPQPRARWCGPRSRERWSPLWRPFEAPLSTAAQRQAVTILKSLYSFLVDQNYLMGNPWSAVSTPHSGRPALDVGRSLTREQWTFVQLQAAAMVDCSTTHRLRLALGLLYATGLRASELVAARVGHVETVEYPNPDGGEPVRGWMLQVLGKGQRLREVPVPNELVGELQAYLVSRGLPGDLLAPSVSAAHLLGHATDGHERAPSLQSGAALNVRGGIAVATLYRQLKRFFARCADRMRAAGDDAGAARLTRASTHWLRHTHASHALASGVPVQVAQQNMGHASLATTTAYVTTEKALRLQAMQGFWESEHKTR